VRPNWKSKGRRIRDAVRRLNEVRVWMLTCHECGHEGMVETTLKRLRAANLICSQCGKPIKRRKKARSPHAVAGPVPCLPA
jgi:transcription elongation factor Elf1